MRAAQQTMLKVQLLNIQIIKMDSFFKKTYFWFLLSFNCFCQENRIKEGRGYSWPWTEATYSTPHNVIWTAPGAGRSMQFCR